MVKGSVDFHHGFQKIGNFFHFPGVWGMKCGNRTSYFMPHVLFGVGGKMLFSSHCTFHVSMKMIPRTQPF
jgi:hypothetical protein